VTDPLPEQWAVLIERLDNCGRLFDPAPHSKNRQSWMLHLENGSLSNGGKALRTFVDERLLRPLAEIAR
jgi:hypothetical protein